LLTKRLSVPALVLATATFSFALSSTSGAYALTGLHAKVHKNGTMCLATHEHTGFARTLGTKRATVRAAVQDWSSFTKFEYGPRWANFRKSHRRRMNCSRHGTGWACKVIASPCKG